MTTLQNVRIGCAAAMLMGVFLPWINIFGTTLPGHAIMKLSNRLFEIGQAGTGVPKESLLVLLPFFILILASITILIEIAASPETKRVNIAGLITGLGPFLGLALFINLAGRGGFQALQMGSYLILTAAGALFVASFDHTSGSESGTPDIETSGGF